MRNLKPAALFESAGNGGTCCHVSMLSQMGESLLGVVSPSDLVGSGMTFDDACEDLAKKLDSYMADVAAFRAMLGTDSARKEFVRMDADGNLMKSN